MHLAVQITVTLVVHKNVYFYEQQLTSWFSIISTAPVYSFFIDRISCSNRSNRHDQDDRYDRSAKGGEFTC